MSADAQETPFSYPRPAQLGEGSGLEAPLGYAGINSSMPSTVGSPTWSPLPITADPPEGAQERNKRLIYFQIKGRKYLT